MLHRSARRQHRTQQNCILVIRDLTSGAKQYHFQLVHPLVSRYVQMKSTGNVIGEYPDT